MKLRCYCCGKEIVGIFALVSFAREDDEAADRVMVFDAEHVEHADELNARMYVREADAVRN